MMLGFTLSLFNRAGFTAGPLYCTLEDIAEVLADRLQGKDALLQASLEAMKQGAGL